MKTLRPGIYKVEVELFINEPVPEREVDEAISNALFRENRKMCCSNVGEYKRITVNKNYL